MRLYDYQEQAVAAILADPAPITLLEAPAGSGKTFIAEGLRRQLGVRGLYVCHSKTLQDQFVRDFPAAAVLKGRTNYPTCTPGSTAEDCSLPGCRWCPSPAACPYHQARRRAEAAGLACLNYDLLFALARHSDRAIFSSRSLIVLDEADLIESRLMASITVEVSARLCRALSLSRPERVTATAARRTGAWAAWVRTARNALIAHLASFLAESAPRSDLSHLRRIRSLTRLISQLSFLLSQPLEDRWILDGYDQGQVVFRPLRIDDQSWLWSLAPRYLLMSSTVISATSLAADLGLPSFRLVRVPCRFDRRRRPIYYHPVGSMARKDRAATLPALLARIREILAAHPGERALIHAHSYALCGAIVDGLPGAFSYASAAGRSRALLRFCATPGAVLAAPSLDRGVDLPHDACRVVIVACVPYPDLSDRQVSARLYSPGGRLWYRLRVVRSLVQATQRACRSETDWSRAWILDAQFGRVWDESRSLFPSWWTEALRRDNHDTVAVVTNS